MHAFRFEAGAPGPAKGATCTSPPSLVGPATAAAADPAYAAALCEAVRCAERAVIYALAFELKVTHPFEAMAAVVNGLDLGGSGNGGEATTAGATPASAPGTPATAASSAPFGTHPSGPLPPRRVITNQGVNLIFDVAQTTLSLDHSPGVVAGGVVLAVLSLLGCPRLKWVAPGGGALASQASWAAVAGGGGATPHSQAGAPSSFVADGPVPWWEAPPLADVEPAAMADVCRVLLERYAGGGGGGAEKSKEGGG